MSNLFGAEVTADCELLKRVLGTEPRSFAKIAHILDASS